MGTKILSAILSTPWLITAEGLELVRAVAERERDTPAIIEALQRHDGQPMDNSRNGTRTHEGVAVIAVTGPILRRASGLSAISGARSLETLNKDFNVALNDPSITGIVLEIDSPGGQVTGINEFAQMIHEARDRKPICAYVEGAGCSAAYWIASAASEIIADQTSVIGSIGVVAGFRDERGRDAKEGVQNIEIVSSQSPNKRLDVATEEGRAQIQTMCDALADVFITTVARNRNVSTTQVINDFGNGGVLVGQHAVDAGLADRLGSLDDAIASVQSKATAKKQTFGGYKMAEKDTQTIDASELQAKLEAQEKQIAALQTAQAEAHAAATVLAEANAKLQADQQRKACADLVAGKDGTQAFAGDHQQHVTLLEKMTAAFGAESAEVKFYVQHNQALAAQLKDGKLFAEFGSDANGGGSDATTELEAKIKAACTADGKLSYEQAYAQVLSANPKLYEQLNAQ